jgi:hypothetical protein
MQLSLQQSPLRPHASPFGKHAAALKGLQPAKLHVPLMQTLWQGEPAQVNEQ